MISFYILACAVHKLVFDEEKGKKAHKLRLFADITGLRQIARSS